MKKYFIYARKSSDSEDRQVLSVDSQIKELLEFAERLKLDVVEVIRESKSAKSAGRPAFTHMIERLESGDVKGVLCWKLDRLARNGTDGGRIISAVKDKRVEVITPTQTYNQEYDNCLLMWFEFGVADQFVRDLSKNVKRGLKAKAEKVGSLVVLSQVMKTINTLKKAIKQLRNILLTLY